jgi:hypothetical protein
VLARAICVFLILFYHWTGFNKNILLALRPPQRRIHYFHTVIIRNMAEARTYEMLAALALNYSPRAICGNNFAEALSIFYFIYFRV